MIKMLVMDVDGTLTDGTINIGPDGELFKSFYARDGLAILYARDYGIQSTILTSRKSVIVEHRAEELHIENMLQGASNDKEGILKEFLASKGLQKHEVAYIGDDINDLEAMSLCGVVGCPSDAAPEVKSIANYICQNCGGRGAVREFIDWIIRNIKCNKMDRQTL